MNNRLPVLSRIDPETRDNDFIAITELKRFDTLLNEIIAKFNSIEVSDGGNIAQKLTDIEYNIADALELDADGNIIGYKKDDSGNPIYGENDINAMLTKLEDYYNMFVSLMGNDSNLDNWKADLNRYYTEAINTLNDKIQSIFRNSVNMAALEAKEDKKNNYVLADAKETNAGSIMRLNPDSSTYIRTVNLSIANPGEEKVAFDVIEAVKDSFAMNLKIQNGSMYFDFNIVLDKGKIFISNERVLPEQAIQISNGYILKIYKYYEEYSTNAHYVFTFSAPTSDIYCFEITGVLVSGFNFDNSGLITTNHSKYFKYTEVVDEEPRYNETYYVKETDPSLENGKISYVPREKLTSFEEGVTYYRRAVQFTQIKEIDIFNYEYDGNISGDGVLKYSQDQVVVEKTKYSKDLKMINVDIETEDIINKESIDYKNNILKNKEAWYPDDSVSFVNRGTEANKFEIHGKGPYKPTNKDIMAFGETIFEKYDLAPGEIVSINDCIVRGLKHSDYDKSETNSKIKFTEKTYYKIDFIEAETPIKLIDKVDFNGSDISDMINNYIMNNIAFMTKFNIKMTVDRKNEDLVYFYVEPDDANIDDANSDIMYYTFALNLSNSKTSVFTFVRPRKDEDDVVDFDDEWYDIASNDNVVIAVGKKGVYYSFDGIHFNKPEYNFDGVDFSEDEDGENKWNIITNGDIFILYNHQVIFVSENGYSWRIWTDLRAYDNETNDTEFKKPLKFWVNTEADYLTCTFIEKIVLTKSNKFCIFFENYNPDKNYMLVINESAFITMNYSDHFNAVLKSSYNINVGDKVIPIRQCSLSEHFEGELFTLNDNIVSPTIKTIKFNTVLYSNNEYYFVIETSCEVSGTITDYLTILTIKGLVNSDIGIFENIETAKLHYETDSAAFGESLANNSEININKNGNLYLVLSNKKLIMETIGGKTWTQSSLTTGSFNCITLANDGTLVAGSYSTSNKGIGIYYSEDNGKTWTQSSLTTGGSGCITLLQDDTLVAGSDNGIYYSEDNGKTWTQSSLTTGYFSCITVANDGTLVAGSFSSINKCIYYSEDNGKTWTQSSISSGYFYCITVANDGTLVTGSYRNGIWYSEDNGKTWIQSSLTTGSFFCITLLQDGTLVAGSSDNGIWYSNDNGKSWTQSSLIAGIFKCITLANDGTLVAGSGSGSINRGIYYSEDNGKTWTQSSLTTGSFNCITLANDGTLVAGSYSTSNKSIGIYYSKGSFEQNTQIQLSENSKIDKFKIIEDDFGSKYYAISDDKYFVSSDGHDFTEKSIALKDVLSTDESKYGRHNRILLISDNNVKLTDTSSPDDDAKVISDLSLTNPKLTFTNQNGISGKLLITDNSSKKIFYSEKFNNDFYWTKLLSYQKITKIYSLPNTSAINSAADNKRGHNGYTMFETNNGRFIYSTLNKTFIKNPADEKCLFDYQFVCAQDRYGVFGVNPILPYKTENGINHYKNIKFDDKFNVSDKINEDGSYVVKYISDSLFIDNQNKLKSILGSSSISFDSIDYNLEQDFYCEYGFETNDGIFVAGRLQSKDAVIFAPHTQDNNYVFELGFTADYIDYLKPYNNDIIISSYDETNDGLMWKFNKETLKFESIELVNGDEIPSFNKIYEINGSLYIWQGSGKRTIHSNAGLAKLYKAASNENRSKSGFFIFDLIYVSDIFTTLISEKEFINISMIEYYQNNKKYCAFILDTQNPDNIELFEINNDILSHRDNNHKDTLINIFEKIRKAEIDKSINYTGDLFLNDPNYNIVTQSDNDCIDYINIQSNEDIITNPNLYNEKFYFDRPNSYIKFETHGVDQEDRRFVLSSEKIAIGTTTKTHKTNIAINLAKDCMISVYDKASECLKTANFAYEQLYSGGAEIIKIDPDHFMFANLIIGTGEEENKVFVLIHGRFPTIISSNGNVNINYPDEESYRLFSIDINSILNYNYKTSEYLQFEEETEFVTEEIIPTSGTIRTYIKNRKGLIPSDQIQLSLTDDLQFIGIANGTRFENTESLIFWNTVSNSIDFVTKINIRNNYKIKSSNNEIVSRPANIVVCEDPSDTFEIYEDDEGNVKRFKTKRVNLEGNNIAVIPYGKRHTSLYDVKDFDKLKYIRDGILDKDLVIKENEEYKDIDQFGKKEIDIKDRIKFIRFIEKSYSSWNCITLANNGTLVAGSNSSTGIWYSKDNGKTWIDSNKSNDSFYCITVANNGRLVTGSNGKGIWYSDDNGETWIDSNKSNGIFYCITVANNGRLVAGSSGKGIWYSDDNGETWTASDKTDHVYNCITLANDGTLVAGSDDNNGIWYSVNNGKTWIQSDGTNDKSFNCITLANNGTLIAGSNNKGILYSDDNGITWTQSDVTNNSWRCITVAQDGTLVAGCYSSKGIWYSVNNGKDWIQSNETSGSFNCITLAQNGTLVASSNEGNGIKYSIDNGLTWNNTNISTATYSCVIVAQDGTLVAGGFNNKGILYSRDNGESWIQSDISINKYKCVSIANDGTLVAGSDNSGIKYSDDNGITWIQSDGTNDKSFNCITVANDGTLVAGSDDDNGIWYSVNNGKTWIQISGSNGYFYCITLANDGTLVAGGNKGIWHSTNNGKTWIQSSGSNGYFYCITLANNGTLIAGSNNKGILYSDDNGITWTQSDVTNNSWRCITVAQDGTLVAGCYSSKGIWYSVNNGKDWIQSSVSSGSFNCITVAQDGTLVAGSDDEGIWYSVNNGKDWIQSSVSSGSFYCITVAQDGTLVAGSNSEGIWYSKDNGRTWNEIEITNSNLTKFDRKLYYNTLGASLLFYITSYDEIKQQQTQFLSEINNTESNNDHINVDINAIKFSSNQNCIINKIFEVNEGIFISTMEEFLFNRKLIKKTNLYKLKRLPKNNSTIFISDETYFDKQFDTFEDVEIYDIKNTVNGLLAVGKYKDIVSEVSKYCIFKYNGNGFVIANENYPNIKFTKIISGTNDIILLKSKDKLYKMNDLTSLEEYLPDENFNLSNTNDEVINPDIYVASENANILISKSKIHYDNDSIDLPVNNSDGHVAKPLFNTILHTRIYKDSGHYDSTSFDKIAKLLYNKGVPLNKTIKVIGSIIYNGIPVSVTNLKIISDKINSDTPLTVVFSVDKEFRLPNDIFDNNDLNFTHNNTGNEYDQFVKKGLISNYDIDTLDRFEEINNVITKCNFTIVCDQ